MGTFPALPAGYMYDLSRDGTIIRWVNRSSLTLISTWNATQIASLCSMSSAVTSSQTIRGSQIALVIMFPTTRSITGIVQHIVNSNTNNGITTIPIYGSTDTTDGIDGSWGSPLVTLGAAHSASTLRTPVEIVGDYKALMFLNSYVHGTYDTVVTAYTLQAFGTTIPDGLALWDPTNDLPLGTSGLDHEDIYVGSPASIKTFRVKNLSSTMTASSINVSINNSSDYGSLYPETTFDIGGGYQSTVNIASLAPGAISPVISMKRAIPTALAAGTIEMAKLQAVATSWV